METQRKNHQDQPSNPDTQSTEKNRSLASDGPVSKAEGTTDSPDLNENDTAKSFDRDQEELDYGFREGDLDNDTKD